MSKLATTAIGGLAALTALLLLRNARQSQPQTHPARQLRDELLLIHTEPRWDTPPENPSPPRTRLLVLPVTTAYYQT